MNLTNGSVPYLLLVMPCGRGRLCQVLLFPRVPWWEGIRWRSPS